MALTGIQIFKLLPKTNCKECGVPTCLAFAMNLASGKAELDSCPHVSDEAKEQLAEASAPPIRPVVLGKGVRKVNTGGETVLYRHEKTFYNPTVLAAVVEAGTKKADLEKLREKFKTIPATELLGEEAKKLKGDIEAVGKSIRALGDRLNIYARELKIKASN